MYLLDEPTGSLPRRVRRPRKTHVQGLLHGARHNRGAPNAEAEGGVEAVDEHEHVTTGMSRQQSHSLKGGLVGSSQRATAQQ